MASKNYVLDVNVLRHSAEICDEKDRYTITILKSLIDLIYYCNSLVLTRELLKQYDYHLNQAIKKGSTGIQFLATFLSKSIHNQNKFKIVELNVYDRNGDENLPKSDKKLIQFSRAIKAMFITSDLDLIKVLSPDDNFYSKKFDIRVCTPENLIKEIEKDKDKKICN